MSEPFFPPDAVMRRVAGEPALLIGAGRALLLQLAHPNVAQGVADHSDYQHNPFKRLQATLEAIYAVTFGSADLARGIGERVHWIHEHVVGPTYRANDAANLLWVHATLFDTALLCYETLVGPLSVEERSAAYEEATRVAEVFGCPRQAQPADLAAFERYVADTVASLPVTDVTRRLARDIIDPRLPMKLHVPLGVPLAFHRRAAIGLTPPRLRDEMGLGWTAEDDRRLERFLRALRATFRRTPRPVRTAPVHTAGRYFVRRATRHVTEFREKQAASCV